MFTNETGKVCVKEHKDKQKSEVSISTFFDICENEEEYDGAILFAVARGKYSEGYNFKDELCRGLFLVGVPNLPLCSPESVLKVSLNDYFVNVLLGIILQTNWEIVLTLLQTIEKPIDNSMHWKR